MAAERLFMYSWYHGEIGRSASEAILMSQRPGLFLMRDSTTCKGGYVLSVSENNKVSHYIITNRDGQYQIGDQTFNDLPEIIEFYKRHFLDTTTLVAPAPRQNDTERSTPAAPPAQPQQDLLKVKAKYNFPGNDPEDLPFRKNDILTILKKEEDQWWMARDSMGKEGMIPANYVEPMVSSSSRSSFPATNPGRPQRTSFPNPAGNYVAPQNNMMDPGITASAGITTVPCVAVATQDRNPSIYDPLELRFQKGDKILILSKRNDDSLDGRLKNGKKGIVPLRFVDIVSSRPEDIAAFNQS